MKKFALIFAVLAALVFTPTAAFAKDKHKKHKSSSHCHKDSRHYHSSYRSSYYAPRYYTPSYSAPRYYSPYRSYDYSRDCDRRHTSYRPSSGFWISFR